MNEMENLGGNGAGSPGNLINISITDELRTAFRDYSMSVIVGRALPDIRDGLKPVHRRILYAMFKEGLLSNKKFSKCAGVVGEVLKKYHPHGDAPVYEALVRMAQPWNMRELLIEGQGNFGSIDGDPPAAYRYTEAKMTKIAESIIADIEKETVDFSPNFDGTVDEPQYLPSRVPNLLVNGSEGIAVAMATKCPPHNLGEVIDGLLAIIAENFENGPTIDFERLEKIIPGPDFPTGGIICGKSGCSLALRTGRGSVTIRGRTEIEKTESGNKERIIITEIPYQLNKARLLERIAQLVREKRMEGISDLRDESDRDGLRVVVEVKRDAMAEVVLNGLFQHTPLQSTYAINMLSIVDGQPMTLNMRQMLDNFLGFRREIVTKRTRFELKEATDRFHIIAGLVTALDDIDRVITTIRASANTEEARQRLIDLQFKNALKLKLFLDTPTDQVKAWHGQGYAQLDETQASAILEMRLSRLVALERDKLLEEGDSLLLEVKRLNQILLDPKILMQVIKRELIEIKEQFANPRRSIFVSEAEELSEEDLIADEDVLVTISHMGYVKRVPLSSYRPQRRGGKGKTAVVAKNEDFVQDAFVASTHAYLLSFTNFGRVYWVKVHELPEGTTASRGRPIINLIQLEEGEQVCAILPVRNFPEVEESQYVVTCTKNGKVKKTDLTAYSNPRSTGLIACGIEENDELIAVKITDGKNDLLLSTKQGMAIRFPETEARSLGRQAVGVRGIKLRDDDAVVSMEVLSNADATILTVTKNGYGKRTAISEYRRQARGGLGLITIKVDERNGPVVSAMQVLDDDEIMIVTNMGKLIRMGADSISTYGRNTKGVRLISVDKVHGESVRSLVYIKDDGEDEAVRP
ncbi:MAG TPA: DNA gyrase subunit A [Myxococcota bacterium]|nr:DNA gyrase subunit A [Myxococcota bacterium]